MTHKAPCDTCQECGGTVVSEAKSDRTRRYRGEDGYVIPADMQIPTCEQCGATWLTSVDVEALDIVFRQQFQVRRVSTGGTDAP